MKHQKTADQAEPVTRVPVPLPTKRRQVLHVATASGAVTVLADDGVTPTDLTLVAELLKRSAEGPFQFRATINGIEITGTDAEAMVKLGAKYSAGTDLEKKDPHT